MAEDDEAEDASRRLPGAARHFRLEDHVGPCALLRREFLQGRSLEDAEPVGQVKRCGCRGIAADVPIQVGARQRQDQGARRMLLLEGEQGGVAAACMQRDHQVVRAAAPVRHDLDSCTASAQHARPAYCRMAVAQMAAGGGGGDKRNSHGRILP